MRIHVVEAGETLWLIAARYGANIARIIEVNQLADPNRLVIGQALAIPAPDRIYFVRAGDTLYRIAQQYGTSVEQIAQANQLPDPDRINVGQRLVIPPAPNDYAVQAGETLWMIAQRFGLTVDSIARENRLSNPSLIYPGQRLKIPRPTIETNGYVTRTGEEGRRIVEDIGENLTYVSIFSYRILADGGLVPLDDSGILQAAGRMRVQPFITITNFVGRRFSPELANSMLSSTAAQERLIDNIISIMQQKGMRGLNIDFEYVFPQDRELYNQFLQRTVARLHPLGFMVSTALAPKVRAEQVGLLYEAHDYPVHGRLADFVVLMTYEWGYAAGPPWAIAPINEVRRVLDYAVTAIPRQKILMGMPTYGRDWRLPFVQGTTIASTISPQEAIRRAAQYGVPIQFDLLYQSPFYYYTDAQGINHVVWFEDARSVQAKFNTVKEYGLRGVSYWELSSPFPQNWAMLSGNFLVRKAGSPY